eukprot:gnl/TRDRNA2_/TRDRNA2_169754_c0_seq6.p1 gnl/TRDRNA2_/TRDRNA2_169754_c0~~gnl/TRDRNA2_/TRDRNA2_169754_c0_seq6.p1  ORF type:complete len:343 (-),score=91.74 gnl/TRDRNA2_/TRDRNA2_169754_c0_seq6:312-1340(-)
MPDKRHSPAEACAAGVREHRSRKRAKVVDVTRDTPEQLCDAVASVLATAPGLSESCAGMLASSVHVSLGVPRNERDAHQEAVVGFIGEALARYEEHLIARERAAEEEVARAQTVMTARAVAHRVAERHLAGGTKAAAAREDALQGDAAREQEAIADFEAARAPLGALEAQLLASSLEMDICTEGRGVLQRPRLQAGNATTETEEVSSAIVKMDGLLPSLQGLGERLGLEQSLLCALPGVARKPAAQRSVLEGAAAQLIGDALASHAAGLESWITSEAEKAPALEAAAEDAKISLSEAESSRMESERWLRTIQEERLRLQRALEAAEEAAREFGMPQILAAQV